MLFNFPSRYLSAIGLATVFSLRWSLPPALGCIPKQPDSGKTRSDRSKRPYGPDTRRGTGPRSKGHRRSPTIAQGLPYVTTRRAPKARRFDAGLVPIHSPLLRESRLVSFPPLNNMLKFSGCSRLNSGRNRYSRKPALRHVAGRRPTARRASPPCLARVGVVSPPDQHPPRGSTLARARTVGHDVQLRETARRRADSHAGRERPRVAASDPEADAVPGLARDRNSRSEGRRSMCSAIHTSSRT